MFPHFAGKRASVSKLYRSATINLRGNVLGIDYLPKSSSEEDVRSVDEVYSAHGFVQKKPTASQNS